MVPEVLQYYYVHRRWDVVPDTPAPTFVFVFGVGVLCEGAIAILQDKDHPFWTRGGVFSRDRWTQVVDAAQHTTNMLVQEHFTVWEWVPVPGGAHRKVFGILRQQPSVQATHPRGLAGCGCQLHRLHHLVLGLSIIRSKAIIASTHAIRLTLPCTDRGPRAPTTRTTRANDVLL